MELDIILFILTVTIGIIVIRDIGEDGTIFEVIYYFLKVLTISLILFLPIYLVLKVVIN